MNVKHLFTIGEFAKLHGINKKTLMWYDEIDLFKPAIIKDNGYRYYSYHQSHLLETILMYKDLGLSLNEISNILKEDDLDKVKSITNDKLIELSQKIDHLNNVYHKLKYYSDGIDTLNMIDVDKISVVDRDEIYLGLSPYEDNGTYVDEITNIIAKLKEYNIKHFRDVTYGTMIKTSKIYDGKYDEYDFVFFELNHYIKGMHIKEKGKYLRAYHVGDWSKIYQTYNRMLVYAKDNHLKLCDYSYEKGINEAFIDDISKYITLIEIKIEED